MTCIATCKASRVPESRCGWEFGQFGNLKSTKENSESKVGYRIQDLFRIPYMGHMLEVAIGATRSLNILG